MDVLIVDYGLGNLWSVRNAFKFMGANVMVSSDPAVVSKSPCLILPGVGNFGSGMQNLHARGLVDALNEAVLNKGAPLLGICLGMQLFADESEEAPGIKGLGLVPGRVLRFRDKTIRLPHMGFNAVAASGKGKWNDFFPKVEGEAQDFYFVHSYCFHPADERHVLARTTYGTEFVSAVAKGTIVGVQFHPEKSQSSGLRLIAEFLKFSAGAKHG
jgi:imidazole glycerol-phosphate synthase subunit HisH